MATVVTLVVLAVGVVLLVVLLTRPRFYAKVTPWSGDPWANWMRRHHLSVAEAGEVEQGVGRGREFSDPRMRAAAVDWAGMQLRAYKPGRGLRIALGVYLVVYVAVAVVQVTAGDAGRVNWSGALMLVAFGLTALHRRKRLRQAIELNGGWEHRLST